MMMSEGWGKVKPAAKYAGISERTLRSWLKQGLNHSRTPSGQILVRYTAIDDFLEGFAIDDNQTDKIVNEVMEGI